tara:strand:- start:1258 stop:1830 length:573 start_codon:yes stop_codon:yes gene_type:complete
MSFMLLGILNSQAAGGGGGAAFDLLETTTLTTSASSVTFSGLGAYSDYKHLQIRIVNGDSLNGAGGTWSTLRMNGDSGMNYRDHALRGTGSSVVSNTNSTNRMYVFSSPYGGGASDGYGAAVIDILDFSSSVKNTTVRGLSGYNIDGVGEIGLFSGLWVNTSAVTNIELQTGNANFVTGSRFSLYGIKGA